MGTLDEVMFSLESAAEHLSGLEEYEESRSAVRAHVHQALNALRYITGEDIELEEELPMGQSRDDLA